MDIRAETLDIGEGDALADEIDAFLDCVRTRSMPLVGGLEGLRALEIASMISGQL
jgi:predicted dehydrogenase